MKVDIKAITALVIIIGCLVLKAFGYNNTIDTILVGAASFYFGLHLPKPE